MSSEIEDIDLFIDSDVGTNTMNLVAELHAVQGIDSDTGSVSIIPPTPKKHRKSHVSSNNSVLRRLAFATAVDGPTPRPTSVHTSTSTPVNGIPSTTSTTTSSSGEHILEILKKTNSKLTEYGERLDTLEKRMCTIEQKGLETPSSSCSDTIKTKVSPAVRHLIRDVYKTLDESEDFVGFDLKKRFTESENQAVLRRVITETKALDDSIALSQIRAAVRRFFQSKQEDFALRANGKYAAKVQNQRRRNRILKKLEARKAALAHTTALTEEKKKSWREILVPSFMSSEESGEEDGKPVLFMKYLPWRATKVSRFLKQMDLKGEKKKSKRSILQTMSRLPGSDSTRLKPTTFESNFWGFHEIN